MKRGDDIKLVRYITKDDYTLFVNHDINLMQLINLGSLTGYGNSILLPKCEYKITIEIKENK